MKYFTREASKQLGNWRGKLQWDRRWARYGHELASIREDLTPGWQEVAGADFHDQIILGFERPTTSELILRLAMGAERVCTLQFLGVREARIPEPVVDDRWLYSEVHLTADGYGDLQALLYRTELRIIATDVGVFRNYDESG